MAGFPDEYDGRVLKLNREGYGRYKFSNKFFVYEGEWVNGKKHGFGKLTMNDGSYYEGEFSNDEIIGHGVSYDSLNHNQYSGVFHMGEKCGNGTMRYGDESVYEGQWVDNKKQGYGRHEYPSGEVYTGFYFNNLRHGEGSQVLKDGSKYVGHWIADMPQGHGFKTYADGSKYEGQWRCGLRHGIGAYHHVSGCKYEGLWTNDSPNWQPVKLRLILSVENNKLDFNTDFSLIIECLDDKNKVCDMDDGREIQILVGITVNKKLEMDKNTSERLCSSSSNVEDGTISHIKNVSSLEDKMTEAQKFVLVNLGIQIEEENLLKGTLTINVDERENIQGMDEDGELKMINSETSNFKGEIEAKDDVENNPSGDIEDKNTKFGNDDNDVTSKNFPKSRSSVEKKIKQKVFYSDFNGVVKSSQGKVLIDQLMITRKIESQRTQSIQEELKENSYKLVIVVRDVTCPPFLGVHLKPDFIMRELDGNII